MTDKALEQVKKPSPGKGGDGEGGDGYAAGESGGEGKGGGDEMDKGGEEGPHTV